MGENKKKEKHHSWTREEEKILLKFSDKSYDEIYDEPEVKQIGVGKGAIKSKLQLLKKNLNNPR